MLDLDALRAIVQDSLGKHLYDNAIFFAGKLVTLSHAAPDDVYLLVQLYVFTRQYRRALNLLRVTKLSTRGPRFRYLTAKCLAECQEWEECLATLPDEAMSEDDGADDVDVPNVGRVAMAAAMQLLRGTVYESLENWPLATKAFISALRIDPLCYEALDRLVVNHMLSTDEQGSLLKELEPMLAAAGAEWLQAYYRCKLDASLGATLAGMYTDDPETIGEAVGGLSVRETDAEEGAADADGVADGAADDADGSGGACGSLVAMRDNADMILAAAEYEYAHDKYRRCHRLSSAVLAKDPFQHAVLPVHICSMTKLQLHSDLFALAHSLVEEYPQSAVSWFAVGCYYHMVNDFESARRFFSKATTLNHRFAPAWVGFGHAFAAQDESDQAMAAYRTASRLFPGSHVPWLGIGIEYLRTNHLPLALQYIRQAQTLCPHEPLVLHELGVLHYLSGDYNSAVEFFLQVAEKCGEYDDASREPSIFNLGHSYRKMRDFDAAIHWYRVALSINPRAASTYSALGFSHHLRGDVDVAIELYHQALSLKPDDTFTSEMLSEALKDALEQADDPLALPDAFPTGAAGAHPGSAHRAGGGASVVSMDVQP